MSNIAKYWREASTVMLISRSMSNLDKASNFMETKIHSQSKHFDYKLLMLERSSKSKFMPSAYVFPGGAIADGDFASEWTKIYEDAGFKDPDNQLPHVKADTMERGPMFTSKRNWAISNRVTFRINAIRETFEETGILLYKKWKNKTGKVDKEQLKKWRPCIYKNDSNFVELCKDLKLVPDVWSLSPWSNWLTPTHMDKMHGNRRYDTAFYMCMHSKSIPSVHDEHEIIKSEVRFIACFIRMSAWHVINKIR